jgi:hypothetical protein
MKILDRKGAMNRRQDERPIIVLTAIGSIHFWQIALRPEVWGYTN